MSNTYGAVAPLGYGVGGNPLQTSLNGGAPANPLNPIASQNAQNQQLTAESNANAQALASLLQKQGANNNGKFTSPWQVAGQWAQALKGHMKQNQANQGAAQLNAATAPGGPGGAAPPAAGVPGQSPATPPAGAPGGGGWNQPVTGQAPSTQPALAPNAAPNPAPLPASAPQNSSLFAMSPDDLGMGMG